ncbi:formyl peptide receptor 2-like [Engystomops pustulosus]|uniref:formyl peptide receptor 2-like n=1 Tax=Engystomops pustulosus TaxID=76066 RepID=UPI003AFB4DCA
MDPISASETAPNTTLDDGNQKFWTTFYKNLEILNTVTVTLYSIIFILGIIGNGLVIWIAGFRMKKMISAVWFLHLAIADLMCCLSLPLPIVEMGYSTTVCQTSLPRHFCSFNLVLFNLNMSASVLLLTAMSIDRWVSVMWPFWAKVHRRQKLVRITAGIIWVLSLVWSGFMVFLLGWYGLFTAGHYTNNTYKLLRLFLMFAFPFHIISACYITIFYKIKTRNRPQSSQRPYRIITAVILCFFICWAPYYIWPLAIPYSRSLLQNFTVDVIVKCLVYLNSCINPIIYVYMGQDFRHRFLISIPFRMENALSEPPDEPCREGGDHEHSPNVDVSPC